jgi:hypothetical protein
MLWLRLVSPWIVVDLFLFSFFSSSVMRLIFLYGGIGVN